MPMPAVLGVKEGINLVFPAFEVMALSVAVILTAIITLDGESHWFEGVQLLALYAMLGAAAWIPGRTFLIKKGCSKV